MSLGQRCQTPSTAAACPALCAGEVLRLLWQDKELLSPLLSKANHRAAEHLCRLQTCFVTNGIAKLTLSLRGSFFLHSYIEVERKERGFLFPFSSRWWKRWKWTSIPCPRQQEVMDGGPLVSQWGAEVAGSFTEVCAHLKSWVLLYKMDFARALLLQGLWQCRSVGLHCTVLLWMNKSIAIRADILLIDIPRQVLHSLPGVKHAPPYTPITTEP